MLYTVESPKLKPSQEMETVSYWESELLEVACGKQKTGKVIVLRVILYTQ